MYFLNPSATRLISNQSSTDLNSEVSFSLTSYLTKAKELNLPYYLSIVVKERWIHAFPKGISVK